MRWRLPRFIDGGRTKWPGLIQPREIQTRHVLAYQWLMNHLNDRFHCWHCASTSRSDYLHPCRNNILLPEFNQLGFRILNIVSYTDPEKDSLAIGRRKVYMPHKHSWRKFKDPFLFNRCLDDQFMSASFDFQRLRWWILFAGHTAMAFDKWEWKTDHRLTKSARLSLASPQWPSTMTCQPGTHATSGSRQRLVQEEEHNVSAIPEIIITGLIIHAPRWFVVSMQLWVLLRQMFKSDR